MIQHFSKHQNQAQNIEPSKENKLCGIQVINYEQCQ